MNFPEKLYKTASQPDIQHNYQVFSEEQRIKQVLLELQANAIRFSKPGEKIKVVCEFIQSTKNCMIFMYEEKETKSRNMFWEDYSGSSENSSSGDVSDMEDIFDPDPQNDKLVISVIDNGVGINKQDKKKLFGTPGLGLAISESIVKAFDGKISVKSR